MAISRNKKPNVRINITLVLGIQTGIRISFINTISPQLFMVIRQQGKLHLVMSTGYFHGGLFCHVHLSRKL